MENESSKDRFDLSWGTTRVTAETIVPSSMKFMMTLAHGAGAGMDHVFMVSLAEELARLEIGTLRFNFPFAEGKKGRPDFPAVAHAAVDAAIQKAKVLFPTTTLIAAGKSFGGRMSSQYMAKSKTLGVRALVFYGFPLHPPGKPSTDRAQHLADVQVPMLFLQGTRDELAQWPLIESVCKELPLATLERLEGADHAFKIPKQKSIPMLAERTLQWLNTLG